MTWRLKIKNYFSDAWNRIDQVMYAMLLLAIILRYTLTDDHSFEWARNIYAVDLVMFYLRILQFYFVEKRLGPKVIMIRRMVSPSLGAYEYRNHRIYRNYVGISLNTVILPPKFEIAWLGLGLGF